MQRTAAPSTAWGTAGREAARTSQLLRAYIEGQRHLRKGICLLNAGQFDRALEELGRAATANPRSENLGPFLVGALVGSRRYDDAVAEMEKRTNGSTDDAADLVRMALLQWKTGKSAVAIQTLRHAAAQHPESAEVHFQLGTMIAALEETEEAELRFTQALAIQKEHTDALVGLAMCCAAVEDVAGAVAYLQRAQRSRPGDARIAMLLSSAAKASRDAGKDVSIRAQMPAADAPPDKEAIRELSDLIGRDPDFAEAFLGLEATRVDESVFNLLVLTIKRAIDHNPHRANLHYLEGRVLERLGRAEEAIEATQRAVEIDPRYVKAFLLLARLYQQTDRLADAATRLEETVRLGAEYADTYYLLGNLYRDTGQLDRARWAYEHALKINGRFEAARRALESLAA